MAENAELREIEIETPAGPVASAIAEAIKEQHDEPAQYIQSVEGDASRMMMEQEIVPPTEILKVAKEALEAGDYEGVPDNPDLFGVQSVDVHIDERSTVTIQVWEV